MAQERRFTGGYIWTAGSRMRGDPGKVAATLDTLKDTIGRVDLDAIKDAWRRRDAALRETMGDEAHVLDVGLDAQAYKILRSLEYEVVDVRTEDVEPGGRVFRTVQDVTKDPESPARQFVRIPVEAIPLRRIAENGFYQPPAPAQPAAPRPEPETVTAPSTTRARAEPRDRDMEAWMALMSWRDRYGDIPRYKSVIDAIMALD